MIENTRTRGEIKFRKLPANPNILVEAEKLAHEQLAKADTVAVNIVLVQGGLAYEVVTDPKTTSRL